VLVAETIDAVALAQIGRRVDPDRSGDLAHPVEASPCCVTGGRGVALLGIGGQAKERQCSGIHQLGQRGVDTVAGDDEKPGPATGAVDGCRDGLAVVAVAVSGGCQVDDRDPVVVPVQHASPSLVVA
jgi:hypothetical protein